MIYIFFALMIIIAGCENTPENKSAENTEGPDPKQNIQINQPVPDENEKFRQLTNLPALYIDVGMDFNKINKNSYVTGLYTFVDGDKSLYDRWLTIKGRGAWSWSHPKKPYTIELLTETSWGGLPEATKWVLIANWSDKSLIRNYITLKFARRINSDWSPDCFYADVFFNGKYNGVYLIAESIEIHKNRLDLDKNTEAVFEIEATYRCENHMYCIDVIGGENHLNYKRPKGKIRDANFKWFENFFAEMQASLNKGYDAYSQFIDVKSFIDWYIVNELTKNFDSGFTSSCYVFYKNGKLHMGPVWDYDTPYGNQDIGPPVNKLNPEGYHVANSPWFSLLTRDDTFLQLLHARWTEIWREGVFDEFLKTIDDAAVYISESAKLNFEKWSDALEFTMRPRRVSRFTHEGEIDYVRNWVIARIDWLDYEWYRR